jgi:uncharacterized membrane protein
VTKAWLVRPLWAAVVLLSLVGAATVIARFSFPDDLVLRLQPQRVRLLERLGRSDPAAVSRLPELMRFERRFAEHRTLTRWHILSAGLFIVLAPLQLVRPVRRRFPVLHRWTGRVGLVSGSAAAVTGLYFGIFLPIAGIAESAIIAVVGFLFLVAIVRALRAIRRRDVTSHREWMLRAFGVMVAVPGTRLMGAALDVAFAPTGMSSASLFAVDLWVTWTLVLGVTEWWIRHTRAPMSTGGVSPPTVAFDRPVRRA